MTINSLLSEETIANKIYFIRNQKVMLDRDLAILYGIETKRLKEQVKRNISRFPLPDDAKTSAAMRPSATLNAIIG